MGLSPGVGFRVFTTVCLRPLKIRNSNNTCIAITEQDVFMFEVFLTQRIV